MGLLSDILSNPHLFDGPHRRREDINSLRDAVANAPDPVRLVVPLARRIDQLELLSKALIEVLAAKNVVSQAELSVVMQQLDLADGTEDGRISERKRKNAPRCQACDRFINPRRDRCVYCDAEVQATAPAKAPTRWVTCAGCNREVAEHDTNFTGRGLRCDKCFAES